jgi:hypothetical protein
MPRETRPNGRNRLKSPHLKPGLKSRFQQAEGEASPLILRGFIAPKANAPVRIPWGR